ncbi:hypothetical protein MBAV_002389 [Candidatus Magnetobacterium bavaricum]|uniref:Uncharacterized protein n=1 Tax=Candidatus Magnetobacterium bavaricum TaxID=29290 RepID=A0A0F3GUB1_9BACT|nr:hypothetical protein MBAV_002389 [Candidatus Magnetobacterium bavaricum]
MQKWYHSFFFNMVQYRKETRKVIYIFKLTWNLIMALYKALTDTLTMEKALESYLCPLQMFLELTRNGWSIGAFKILRHDLNIKRIFFTKLTIEYFNGIRSAFRDLTALSLHNGADTTAVVSKGINANVQQVHDKSRDEMKPWENVLSIPLFTIGVLYAIALNVRRTIVNSAGTLK